MASRDLHSNVTAKVAFNTATLNGVGRSAGNILDTLGFRSVELLVLAGSITSGSVTPVLEEGAAANLSDAATVTQLIGSIAAHTKSPTDDSNAVKRFGYIGHKRYIRLSLDKAGTHASGTATLGTGVAAAEKVTIESHDFVAAAKYATATVAFSTVVADNAVTIASQAFTAKVSPSGAAEFALGAGDAEALANLAAKVNAHPVVGLLVQMDGTSGVVTAVAEGAAGNLITITKTGSPITLTGTSSGKLSGAYDASADEWPLDPDGDLSLSAAALAAAINASETVGIAGVVTATAAAAVATIAAVVDGTAGNSLTLTKTGSHVTVSGSGTLAGGVNMVGTFGALAVLGHPWTGPTP